MDTVNSALPPPQASFLSRWKSNLFGSVLDSVISLVCLLLLVLLIYNLVDWAFLSSIWAAEDEPLCNSVFSPLKNIGVQRLLV